MKSPVQVSTEMVEPTMACLTAALHGEYLDAKAHLERAAVILREAEEGREQEALVHPI